MNFEFQVVKFTVDSRFVVPWNEFLTEKITNISTTWDHVSGS